MCIYILFLCSILYIIDLFVNTPILFFQMIELMIWGFLIISFIYMIFLTPCELEE